MTATDQIIKSIADRLAERGVTKLQPGLIHAAIADKDPAVTAKNHSLLEQQLEDSLWARATIHTPAFTREQLFNHVGPGHMLDDWYVKRTYHMEVHLLCRCGVILVLSRCMYGCFKSANFENSECCDEPAFPQEATLRKDARCAQHHGQ